MARPIHVLRAKRAFIVNSFFFATVYDWSFSLFNTRRTVATDPASAFGCRPHTSHIGQTNSLSAFASFYYFSCVRLFRAFSVYLCILTGFFSLPFRIPSSRGCLMKSIVNF
jgi:hypothetical protein